jgi:antitoxin PrlF
LAKAVTVTQKGQATIPKKLRQKYGIKDKVFFEENEKGILIKPLPSPNQDFGSLKPFSKGKTAKELLEDSRKTEYTNDKAREKRVGTSNL